MLNPVLNLKDLAGKITRVTVRDEYAAESMDNKKGLIQHYFIIRGKSGEIWPWGMDTMEVYMPFVTRSNRYARNPHFKHKNQYDDGRAFLVDKSHINEALEAIKAPKRRVMTPEQRAKNIEILLQARLSQKIPLREASGGGKIV